MNAEARATSPATPSVDVPTPADRENEALKKEFTQQVSGMIWNYGNVEMVEISWKYAHPTIRPGANSTPYIELGQDSEGRPLVGRVFAEFAEPETGHMTGNIKTAGVETEVRTENTEEKDGREFRMTEARTVVADKQEKPPSSEKLREGLKTIAQIRARYEAAGIHTHPDYPDPDHW